MRRVVVTEIGRCLTDRRVEDFSRVCGDYDRFIRTEQWRKQPSHLDEWRGPVTSDPYVTAGHVVYGVENDGTLTWLGEIVDSSD